MWKSQEIFCEHFVNYGIIRFLADFSGGNAKSAALASALNAMLSEFSRTLIIFSEVIMAIRGGACHQILYINNIEWIDNEGYGRIEWNPPSFTINGHEIPEADYVEIDDDLFGRFHDFFNWIETYNPVGPKEFNCGFNYCGQTAIRDENLLKFGRLIDSLMDLFKNAPENIALTGCFRFGYPPSVETPPESDDDPQIGYYQKLEVKKDDLIKVFDDLINMTNRAVKNKGYLLHFGI